MSSVLHALVRSGLVLTGLLLLAVGIGNVFAGRSKLEQYGELAALTQPHVASRPPATLFPAVSEGEERHRLANAKKDFYELLVNVGWMLGFLGFALFAIGTLRVWTRTSHPQSQTPVAN